ncbi:hypothetical protein [Roseofilum casamattae]|uniref:Sugar ABC transporter ATP-binding protein n=1 Tax=Roseofilum casamattae BLCC-M143 TaxID=3022442 RepID=A0ABT7C1X1_9CYAN|nr:hypothetical protein [Roseofilum casamattae]MDJ1185443.1 sugar ABC transporter ATP-binding protein [Roseofilum casamattae BLCC-M143]
MKRPISRRSIPPKISTIPRQQCEASDYLNLYQLAVEKQRLCQELQTIEQRTHQIQTRLAAINHHMNRLKKNTPSLSPDRSSSSNPSLPGLNPTRIQSARAQSYDMLTLDY